MTAIDRLIDKIDEKSNPSVVGLDPRIQGVPNFIKQICLKKYGNTVQAAAESLYLFNQAILNAIHEIVPAVKPQMACYELYGSYGMAVYERTVSLAKKLDLIVIDDSKRNDIGSTAQLYAMGHLGRIPLIEGETKPTTTDFLTVNPWLGSDGIKPFLQECLTCDKGIFLLVKTSNPSSAQFQGTMKCTSPVYKKVSDYLHRISLQFIGNRNYSSIGAVVGATHPKEAEFLRKQMPYAYFLVPGYGAQGGSADDTVACFNEDGYGAIINSSRGIIFAQDQPLIRAQFPREEDFAAAATKAAMLMKESLLLSLKSLGKLPSNW